MKKKIIVITLFLLLVLVVIAADVDNDGMPDDWETANGLNINIDDSLLDPDMDLLTNLQEFMLGCHPQKNDTDGDTFKDFREFQYQTDCNDSTKYPTTSLINISLVNPKFGVSRVSSFNFSVKTNYVSECKYTSSPDKNFSEIEQPSNFFHTNNGLSHNIEDFTLNFPDNYQAKVYILCYSEDLGYVNDDFPTEIILSVDRTKPVLNAIKATPNPVIERLEVELQAETDDKSLCRFVEASSFNENPDDYFKWFDNHKKSEYKTTNTLVLSKTTTPKVEDEKNYRFLVHCQNLALAFTEQIAEISFSVNLSTPNAITGLLPDNILEGRDAKLTVITNKDSTCRLGQGYTDTFPQADTKYHYIEEYNLTEGVKSYAVMCIFNDLGSIEDEIRFIVDTTKPSAVDITTNSETCSFTSLNAVFNASDFYGIKGYYYRIIDSSNKIIINYTFTENNNKNLTGLNLVRGIKYYWEVYAVDTANNNGITRKSTGTEVLLATHDLCVGNQEPYLNATSLYTESGIDVKLKCYDPDLGGSCTSIKYFISDDCDCDDCHKIYTSTTSILIKNQTKICYKITDNRNSSVESNIGFSFNTCTNNTTCCMDKQAKICMPDCEIITNIDCNPDQIDNDGDGIPDIKETACSLDPNDQSDADLDNDDDGLSNKLECGYGTDINKKDTDNDGVDDKTEISKSTDPLDPNDYWVDPNKDSDNDGIPDLKETSCGLDLNDRNDANLDNDKDGLSNKRECLTYGTNLEKKDTDGDKVNDNVEIDKGTDPLDSSEFPKSHVLSIVLSILGLGLTIAGVVLFLQDNKGLPKSIRISKKTAGKPLINFKQTKKEMNKEIKQGQEMPSQTQMPTAAQQKDLPKKPDENSIDKEIMKKKRLLKLKKMNSIFDEFADDTELLKEPELKRRPKIQMPVKKEDKSFQRLDDMSEEDAFEELEKISKKKKR